MAKYVFEGIARVPVEVDLASEYRYRDPIFDRNTLVIIVSQSEKRRIPCCLRESKANGQRVLGIVNVVGSSIAREADNVMYTWAGPEISSLPKGIQRSACILLPAGYEIRKSAESSGG